MTAPSPQAKELERVLLVDDNPTNLQVLFQTLDQQGYKLLAAKSGEVALKIIQKAHPALVLLDIMMPGMDGYEVCRQLKANPETAGIAVIFLSALDDVQDKVRGLQLGAVDFITKPFQAEEVLVRVRTQITLQQLRRTLEQQNQALQRELGVARELLQEAHVRAEGPLLGESRSVQMLREHIAVYASTEQSILLQGPPGAGFEAVARTLHHQSPRSTRTFFHVNCAVLDAEQSALLLHLDSHTAPATEGKFWLADGGTMFLERVDELDLQTQHQLMELLQRLRHAQPHDRLPNVRMIAHSFRDLDSAVADGKFLSGLVPLLGQHRLFLPSLVERLDDLPTLAHFFMKQHARRLGKIVDSIDDSSLLRLRRYSWPGNVQELRSMIEREVAVTRGSRIQIETSLLEGGITIGGYRLLKKLGQGGMGEVWLARHQLLARPAAVKLIRPADVDADKKEMILKRFQREAKATARLESLHTVKLYDFGVDDSGRFYYVMELLRGMDLHNIVQRFGPVSPQRLAALLHPVCHSLGEAHAMGLVHRDIKPANIFVCRQGTEYDVPKVLDFGIVKGSLEQEGEAATALTGAEHKIVGTPGFIAPEMINGKFAVDGRADVYALGCVAFWAATGKDVFSGKNPMSILFKHAFEEPPRLSSVASTLIPAEFEALVMRCLAKEPAQRPHAIELAQLFEALPNMEWNATHAEQWWRAYIPSLCFDVENTAVSSVSMDMPATKPV